jgi:hypothetical protein
MIWIPSGTVQKGSDVRYAEGAPAHRLSVDGLWIDIRAHQSPVPKV